MNGSQAISSPAHAPTHSELQGAWNISQVPSAGRSAHPTFVKQARPLCAGDPIRHVHPVFLRSQRDCPCQAGHGRSSSVSMIRLPTRLSLSSQHGRSGSVFHDLAPSAIVLVTFPSLPCQAGTGAPAPSLMIWRMPSYPSASSTSASSRPPL